MNKALFWKPLWGKSRFNNDNVWSRGWRAGQQERTIQVMIHPTSSILRHQKSSLLGMWYKKGPSPKFGPSDHVFERDGPRHDEKKRAPFGLMIFKCKSTVIYCNAPLCTMRVLSSLEAGFWPEIGPKKRGPPGPSPRKGLRARGSLLF